ncbi:hypothetical protein M3J09_005684 [Ascochyta lentis]
MSARKVKERVSNAPSASLLAGTRMDQRPTSPRCKLPNFQRDHQSCSVELTAFELLRLGLKMTSWQSRQRRHAPGPMGAFPCF